MKYRILYSRHTEKYLARLTPSKVNTVLNRIQYVSLDPFKPDNNIVKLSGTISGYRLRIGDIRVIYSLNIQAKTMFIVKIAPRGAAYSQ